MFSQEKENYKILYVEDDEDDFNFLVSELKQSERATFSVDWAMDEDDVFTKDISYYDIIIIDYRLPTTNGIALMNKIREHLNEEIPFIIFTASLKQEVDQMALNNGAHDYLIKGKTDSYLLEKTILYAIERYRYIKKLKFKKEILSAVLNCIHAAVYLIDENNKVFMANEKAKELFSEDIYGENIDDIFQFYSFLENTFELKLKDKEKISNLFIDECESVMNGIVKTRENNLIYCILSTNIIKETNKQLKLVSIIDNSIAEKEKQILRKTTQSLEKNIEKYGLEKKNPKAIIDLVNNEIDKIFEIEEN